MQRTAAIALVSGVAVLGVAVLAAAATAEEVSSYVDPSTRQTIRTYRLLDSFTIQVSEPSNATLDLANGLLLAAGSGVALAAACVARRRRVRAFFFWAAAGTGYLALDEVLELNESYELNLDRAGLPSNLDLVGYGLAILVFAAVFRDILVSSRRAVWLAAAAFTLFGGAQALDALIGRLHGIEEHIEPVASVLAVAALLALAVEQLDHRRASAGGAGGHDDAARSRPPAPAGERERSDSPA